MLKGNNQLFTQIEMDKAKKKHTMWAMPLSVQWWMVKMGKRQ